MASGALGTAGASLAEVPPGQCPHTLYISQECDLLAGVTRPAASLSPGFSLAHPLSREAVDVLGLLPEQADRKSRWAAFSLGLAGSTHMGVVASGKTRVLPGVVTWIL